jgi:BICD family-like cargo adapter
LEQEKHVLKRQLEVAESECDSNVLELQADLKELKLKLDAQEQLLKQTEREKNSLIEEITAQNTRLATELQRSNLTEAQLSSQLNEMRDQFNRRNQSIQDHVNSLESLKNELKLILEKKHELEHRLQLSLAEKETLTLALTEASDRIHTLERSTREQDTKFKNTIKTLDRLERENSTLNERLESFDTKNGSDPQSLLHEMSCDDGISVGDGSNNSESFLKKEAFAVYKQLKTLCQTLKITQNDDDSGKHNKKKILIILLK